MVKKLFNLFNKRKREIERLNNVIKDLNNEISLFKSNIRFEQSKISLLEREKDAMFNKIKSYEDQVKRLNLTISDLSRTSNNYREY